MAFQNVSKRRNVFGLTLISLRVSDGVWPTLGLPLPLSSYIMRRSLWQLHNEDGKVNIPAYDRQDKSFHGMRTARHVSEPFLRLGLRLYCGGLATEIEPTAARWLEIRAEEKATASGPLIVEYIGKCGGECLNNTNKHSVWGHLDSEYLCSRFTSLFGKINSVYNKQLNPVSGVHLV